MKSKLTLKQRRFCQYYLMGTGNATEAVIQAGYDIPYKAGKIDRAVAKSIAWENLTKPHIQAYINEQMRNVGLSDTYVALQHMAMIQQHHNLGVKIRAIDLYYKKTGAYAAAKLDLTHQIEIVEVTNYADSQSAHKDAGHGQ